MYNIGLCIYGIDLISIRNKIVAAAAADEPDGQGYMETGDNPIDYWDDMLCEENPIPGIDDHYNGGGNYPLWFGVQYKTLEPIDTVKIGDIHPIHSTKIKADYQDMLDKLKVDFPEVYKIISQLQPDYIIMWGLS